MKYFIDTEFLEGPQKEKFPISLFRKNTPPTIDLISIGIVAEDGREYYAISKDFNLDEAWNRYDLEEQSGDMRNIFPEGRKIYWLRENVLKPIWRESFKEYELTNDVYSNKQANVFVENVDSGSLDHLFCFRSMKSLLELYGKTNKQIAEEVKHFCNSEYHSVKAKRSICSVSDQTPFAKKPEFYAYYADYDWVVFCWIFGKMMDLPNGFPMYCKDLKQMMDDKQNSRIEMNGHKIRANRPSLNIYDVDLKNHPGYPKQENEHSAIDDARWNKKLFDFLNTL